MCEGEPDIICLAEAHLKNNDQIQVHQFKFYGANRKSDNMRNVKGSGGIGILIKYPYYRNMW